MKSYSHEYEIHTPDLTPENTLRLTSLMGYLQDVSNRHYRNLIGEGELDALWLIAAWDVELLRPVQGLQRLRVTTTPTYFRRFLAVRAYEVFDSFGELVARGYSKWAAIHPVTHEPLTVSDRFYEVFGVDASKQKLNRFEAAHPPADPCDSRSYTPVFFDIDQNRHVNNISYIRWAVDCCTTEELRGHEIRRVMVSYKKEGHEGEPLTIRSEKNARSVRCGIANQAQETVAVVEFQWERV